MGRARGAGGRAHKSVLPNCAMPESSEPSMPGLRTEDDEVQFGSRAALHPADNQTELPRIT